MVFFLAVLTLCVLAKEVVPVEARLGSGAEVLNADNFEAFIKKNEKAVVDFYDPNDPDWRVGQSELDTAIRNLRDMGSKVPLAKVDASKEKDLAFKYVKHGRYPQLVWFYHGELTQYHRNLRNNDAISTFVLALDRDPMIEVEHEEEARAFNPAVFARVMRKSPLFKILQVIGSKHMDTVAFTFIEGNGNELRWFSNAKPSEIEATGEDKTVYKGEHTVEAVEKWVKFMLLKSEPIPEDPALLEDEGSKVVVGRNFEDIILQKDKDVVFLVCSPTVGFCKKFAPVWNAFAKSLEGVQHLVVAKMDGSRNETPLPDDFSWNEIPHIMFVKAGEKKPIHYSKKLEANGGDLSDAQNQETLEKLIAFVKESSSKPVTLVAKTGNDSINANDGNDL